MLNTVNIFFLPFIFDLLFVTRDCTPILVCSSFKTLFSTNMDDLKCERTKEAPFQAGRRDPLRLFLEDERRKVEALFLSSSRVFMTLLFRDAFKIKSTLKH